MGEVFQLAEIFNSHMVLQRDTAIKVWGSGPNKSRVTLTISQQVHSTTISHNKWCITLEPLCLGPSLEMKVTCGDEAIIITDILIGDVYLCSGQSNMAMPLRETNNGDLDLYSINLPEVRLCDMVVKPYEGSTAYISPDDTIGWEIKTSDLKWQPCSWPHIHNFSSIGYHFASHLYNAYKIPIGIVNCSFGGRPICTWIREDYFKENDELLAYYKDFEQRLKEVDPLAYMKAFGEYLVNICHYISKQTTIWPTEPFGPFDTNTPSVLYHSMLERIVPFHFKAILWYQGESDELISHLYTNLFKILIKNWREVFENPDLPFFYVQLPNFNTHAAPNDPYLWGKQRLAQEQVTRTVPHTYMVVSTDIGEMDDIHPKDKRPVAVRLAALVQKYLYNENIAAESPRLYEAKLIDSHIHLLFEGDGLPLVRPNEPIYINVVDYLGQNHPILAEICDNQILLDCTAIPKPLKIHYCLESSCEAKIFDSNTLPVAPFCKIL